MMPTVRVVDLVSADGNKKYEPAGRMAAAIIEIMEIKGQCDPQDIRERGFTSDELGKHWHLAQSLAEVELRLIENELLPTFKQGQRYV